MRSVYRIVEGYGNPELPETLTGVEFLDITFTNENHAIKFVWDHYNNRTDGNPNWQEFWASVTTTNTIAEALAEQVKEMEQYR